MLFLYFKLSIYAFERLDIKSVCVNYLSHKTFITSLALILWFCDHTFRNWFLLIGVYWREEIKETALRKTAHASIDIRILCKKQKA